MVRSYSLTENPFCFGLRHLSFNETDKACGFFRVGTIQQKAGSRNRDPHYVPLTKLEKGAYYGGRLIRFGISVPGTIIEVALRALVMVAVTFELFLMKGEALARGCTPKQTVFYNWFVTKQFSPYLLFRLISQCTTVDEPFCLAQDLRLVHSKNEMPNVSNSYTGLLCKLIQYR